MCTQTLSSWPNLVLRALQFGKPAQHLLLRESTINFPRPALQTNYKQLFFILCGPWIFSLGLDVQALLPPSSTLHVSLINQQPHGPTEVHSTLSVKETVARILSQPRPEAITLRPMSICSPQTCQTPDSSWPVCIDSLGLWQLRN